MLVALLVAAAAAPSSSANPPLVPLTREFDALAKGSAGVSFVLPGGGAPDVGVTFLLADNVGARIDFGLDAMLAPSGTPALFSINLGLRFYGLRRGPVAGFFSPAIGFGREKIAATDAAEYLAFSGAFGVEYFFADHLSAGGQLGLGLKLANLGAPVPLGGTVAPSVSARLNTSTSALFLNIYF